MRNPLTMIQEAYRSPRNGAVHDSVDELRQRVIQTNAVLGLALVALAAPFAVMLALRHDMQLVLHAIPLTIGSLMSWQLARNGNVRWAMLFQLLALTSMGACITMLNVQAGAIGMTVAAIAGLYAYLLGDTKTTKAVLAIAIVGFLVQGGFMIQVAGFDPRHAAQHIDLSVLYVMIPLAFVAMSLALLREATTHIQKPRYAPSSIWLRASMTPSPNIQARATSPIFPTQRNHSSGASVMNWPAVVLLSVFMS